MKPRYIKRIWALWTLMVLLLAAGAAVLPLWPRLFPSHLSDLYLRYEHNPHIRATELRDFPVDDTLAVDALLLQADTDSAWYALMADFGMSEDLIEEYRTNAKLANDRNVTLFSRDKNDPKKRSPKSNPDSRVVSMSYAKKSLCVFLSEDKTIKEAIVKSETLKVSKKPTNKKRK